MVPHINVLILQQPSSPEYHILYISIMKLPSTARFLFFSVISVLGFLVWAYHTYCVGLDLDLDMVDMVAYLLFYGLGLDSLTLWCSVFHPCFLCKHPNGQPHARSQVSLITLIMLIIW